ncbi:MAG: hypothetical protein P4L31_02750 [Candidatus Babeliales bacterium]|nr:hypothetical protein [Candidatus Babeliales bacterium]
MLKGACYSVLVSTSLMFCSEPPKVSAPTQQDQKTIALNLITLINARHIKIEQFEIELRGINDLPTQLRKSITYLQYLSTSCLETEKEASKLTSNPSVEAIKKLLAEEKILVNQKIAKTNQTLNAIRSIVESNKSKQTQKIMPNQKKEIE